MKKKNSDKKEISVEQLTVATTITLEALMKVLENKGLVNSSEIIEEIKQIKSADKQVYN